ncbi:MAG: hypothetical protein D6722_02630 [Bacteroidetes bacterium]|nr:MAG: hypothetical protein D6722_02630 [Bacteroidota bacterium]
MKRLSFFLCFTITFLLMSAQQTGRVDYKHLGIQFTIPDGWVGQEIDGGFLMGHNSIPGLILLSTHEYQTLNQLRAGAVEAFNDGNGSSLVIAGQLESLGNNALGGEYQGTIEWQPAKAYGIGLINPHGTGVVILAATTAAQYGPDYKRFAQQVQQSFRFYKPDHSQVVATWKPFLSGMRLTYMDSYYSPGVGSGGIGGGYSNERIIELCSQGHFFFSSSSEMTISGDNVSGWDQGGGQGQGRWEIAVNAGGSPILRLRFQQGEVYEYVLSRSGNELYLDGNRNYRTQAEYCR